MGLANIMKISTKPIIGVDEFLEKKPDGIMTVVGFEFKTGKDADGNPERKAVYHIKELGGLKLWGAGRKMKQEIPEELLDEYGDEAAIDAGLRARPIKFKVYPTRVLPNRRKFRPIDCLGYEEPSADDLKRVTDNVAREANSNPSSRRKFARIAGKNSRRETLCKCIAAFVAEMKSTRSLRTNATSPKPTIS